MPYFTVFVFSVHKLTPLTWRNFYMKNTICNSKAYIVYCFINVSCEYLQIYIVFCGRIILGSFSKEDLSSSYTNLNGLLLSAHTRGQRTITKLSLSLFICFNTLERVQFLIGRFTEL